MAVWVVELVRRVGIDCTVFDWLTEPSSPGLSTRTSMFVFVGSTCAADEAAPASCAFPADWSVLWTSAPAGRCGLERPVRLRVRATAAGAQPHDSGLRLVAGLRRRIAFVEPRRARVRLGDGAVVARAEHAYREVLVARTGLVGAGERRRACPFSADCPSRLRPPPDWS